MNLNLMFQAQKELREHIGYNGEDRFDKSILALLVEIGECANEWQGFKFWSDDQEPNELKYDEYTGIWFDKKGKPYIAHKNLLLEEYVDGLHIVIDLGIESGVTPEEPWWMPKAQNVLKAFTSVFHAANGFGTNREIYEYRRLFALYIRLGEALGFTDEQIETAYFAKNEVNHQRQVEGY